MWCWDDHLGGADNGDDYSIVHKGSEGTSSRDPAPLKPKSPAAPREEWFSWRATGLDKKTSVAPCASDPIDGDFSSLSVSEDPGWDKDDSLGSLEASNWVEG